MSRQGRITREVSQYDRDLYCDKLPSGALAIYKKSYAVETYDMGDSTLIYNRSTPWFVFALTTDSRAASPPADWGLEAIMAKLSSIDSHRRDIAADLIKGYEKTAKGKELDNHNRNEAFAKYELRDAFKKVADETVFHSVETNDKRYEYDKLNK